MTQLTRSQFESGSIRLVLTDVTILQVSMFVHSISRTAVCAVLLLGFSSFVYGDKLTIKELEVESADKPGLGDTFLRALAAGEIRSGRGFAATIAFDNDGSGSKIMNAPPSALDTFYATLPFEWHVISSKPLLHVLPEFANYSSTQEIEFEDLLRIFNIEVLVPRHFDYSYPSEATLVFELRSRERAIQVDLPMSLDSDATSYFIDDPVELARELSFEFDRFDAVSERPGDRKPRLNIVAFRGFGVPDEMREQDTDGIPIAYRLKFGSFIFDSGSQSLGVQESSESTVSFKQLITH